MQNLKQLVILKGKDQRIQGKCGVYKQASGKINGALHLPLVDGGLLKQVFNGQKRAIIHAGNEV